jgi:plastocyanin
MRLHASRSAAAVLAAAAIPLPVYLVAARDAAASTRHASASTRHEAAAQAKAANRAQRRAEHRSRERAARLHRHRHRARTHAAAAKHRGRTATGKSWKLTFPGAGAAGSKRVHSNVSARAAAGDPADTISDFKFTPGSITVHVGDTVTWTNNGPTDHTATANDGSFNTGTLKKGQSASHTFTKTGTFAYICSIHPFMKGTIVVDASTSSSTPSSGSSGSGGSTSGSTGTGAGTSGSSGATGGTGSSSGTTGTSASGAGSPSAGASGSSAPLPVTGLDLSGAVLSGLGLLGAGALLRLRTRSKADASQ